MIETIIYIRTSTEDQNPENQINDCLKINNWGEYEIIEDKQSAWKDDKEREGFERIKKLIRERKIKHLIVWDFDRVFRNRKKFVEFLSLLKAFNVELHSYRQEWFEDLYKIPFPWNEIVSELLINVYGNIAEEESKKKSERVKISVRKKDGITQSYKGNKWGRKSIGEETKQAIIEQYKANKSYSDICSQVFYWDKNRNKKFVSRGIVHKTIKEFKGGSNSF